MWVIRHWIGKLLFKFILISYCIICLCIQNSDSERTHTSFYKVFKNGSKVSYKLNNEMKLSNCSSIIQLVGQNIILKKRKKARTIKIDPKIQIILWLNTLSPSNSSFLRTFRWFSTSPSVEFFFYAFLKI